MQIERATKTTYKCTNKVTAWRTLNNKENQQ